jgi:hypothetical protein
MQLEYHRRADHHLRHAVLGRRAAGVDTWGRAHAGADSGARGVGQWRAGYVAEFGSRSPGEGGEHHGIDDCGCVVAPAAHTRTG